MSIFNDLSNKFNVVSNDVKKQTKNYSEVKKLNASISKNNKQIDEIFVEFGKYCFDEYMNGNITFGKEFATNITELLDKNNILRKEIERVKGTLVCQKCGEDISKDALFCPKCGYNIKNIQKESNVKTCATCGTETTEDDALFCGECGSKL